MTIVSLPLTKIVADGDTQPRAAIHDDTVLDYAESLAAGTRFPPLAVFHDGTCHWLADGFHRFHGARKAGLKTLPCELHEGTVEDARWYATGANTTHGLRRTNADKRRAVKLALQLHPEYSDRQIAEHCGVSDFLVRDARFRCENLAPERIGRDGKSYPVPPLPPGDPAPAPNDPDATAFPPPDEPSDERPAIPPVPPMPPALAMSASVAGPAPVVDGVGRVIPPHLHELWARRHEITDMMHAISTMRGALQRASEQKDPLFTEMHCLIVVSDLKLVYQKLSTAVPFALCTNCHGLKPVMEGCRLCSGNGLISQYRWRSLVSEHTKQMILSQIGKA